MRNFIMKAKVKCCNAKKAYDKKVKDIKNDCKEKKEIAKRNLVDSICNG